MIHLRDILNLYFLRRMPFSLVHFITEECNARCGHCFLYAKRESEPDLTLEEINQLSARMGNCLVNVNITGGEPFLRKDISGIVDAYFRNAKVRSVYITTNGSLTKEIVSFCERFCASDTRGLLTLSISIDGIGQEHDQLRSLNGLFEKAMDSYRMVDSLGDKRVMANVNVTVRKENCKKLDYIYAKLKESGVRSVTFTALRQQGRTKIDAQEKTDIAEAYCAATLSLHSDISTGKFGGFNKNFAGRVNNSKNRLLDTQMRSILKGDNNYIPCRAASLFGVISASGTVYPCEMTDKPLGYLRREQMDFMKIWNSRRAHDETRRILDGKCSCSYGCALSVNILAQPQLLPCLVFGAFSGGKWTG